MNRDKRRQGVKLRHSTNGILGRHTWRLLNQRETETETETEKHKRAVMHDQKWKAEEKRVKRKENGDGN